jgi:DNA-binding HxlR family transcriptional regulator/DNA-binding CsgD family transcriptional regulator
MEPETRLRAFQVGGRGTEHTAEMARNEDLMDDANKFAELALADVPIGVLSPEHPMGATSFRLNEVLLPQGFASELRLVLREGRRIWGALSLFREDPRRSFGEDDIAALSVLADPLTAAARTFPVRPLPPTGRVPGAAVITLAPDDRFVAVTEEAWSWLQLLVPGGDDETWITDVTRVVYEVAHAARAGDQARAATCVRTVTGRWLRVEASTLTGGDADIGVLLHAATPHELIGPFASRHGLTRRERQSLELTLHGRSTRQAARELGISPETVSAHLSAAYRKCRVSGRDELFGPPAVTPAPGTLTAHLHFASITPCALRERPRVRPRPLQGVLHRPRWSINEQVTDDNAACFVLDDTTYLMALRRDYYASLGDGSKEVGDPATTSLVTFAFDFPTRADVDAFVPGRSGWCEGGSAGRLRLHVPAAVRRPRRQPLRAVLDGPGGPAPGVMPDDREGLATALELVGRRWALLVVASLLDGPKRYGDLQRELGAPTNILATRLRELQEAGILDRLPLAHSQRAYALTRRGAELRRRSKRWGVGRGNADDPGRRASGPGRRAPACALREIASSSATTAPCLSATVHEDVARVGLHEGGADGLDLVEHDVDAACAPAVGHRPASRLPR